MQHAIAQAATALRSVNATIQRMSEIAIVIATSVETQGRASSSSAQAVQDAVAGAAEVTSNVAAVTSMVEETGVRASAVLVAATEATDQTVTLKVDVARFLIAVA
jgi:methyl-accepting chemotaxis protein